MKRTEETFRLSFINVGYGEAIWIEGPHADFTMLIDAGSDEDAEYADASTGRIRTARYLDRVGADHIDWMVATHIHEDHLSGLRPVADRWTPRVFWQTLPVDLYETVMRPLPVSLAQNASQDKFIRALNDSIALTKGLQARGCGARRAAAPFETSPCEGLRVRALAPDAAAAARLEAAILNLYAHADDDPELLKSLSALDAAMNNFSLILRLDVWGTGVLLPGDTNRAGYGGVADEDLRADIFKVGHHGQKDGASEALLDRVRPGHVVCCASSDRRYQSAAPELMSAIRGRGAKLWFSDCPEVLGVRAPAHRALTFEIDRKGILEVWYQTVQSEQ